MDKDKQIQKTPDYSPEDLTKYSNLLQRGLLDIDKINDPISIEQLKIIVKRGLIKAQLKRGGKLSENPLEDEDIWKAILEEFSCEEAQMNEANKKMVLPKNLARLKRLRELKEKARKKLEELRKRK